MAEGCPSCGVSRRIADTHKDQNPKRELFYMRLKRVMEKKARIDSTVRANILVFAASPELLMMGTAKAQAR